MSALANYRTEPMSSWYNEIKIRHAKKIHKLLINYISSDAKILEIGPGHGHFARQIQDTDLEYEAIEPSDYFREGLIEQCFKVTKEAVPPILRDAEVFDLLYASMVIENLPSSYEAGEFACESARVLKKDGMICLIFPNYLTWGRFFFDEHYTHSFETTPRRISHLLTSQGFEIVRIEHTLGWFWVEGGVIKNALRHIINMGMWFMHTAAVRWAFVYLGLGELHWKVRKTLFEAVVVIARKK